VTRTEKTTVRETLTLVRDGGDARPLIVELHARHVVMRLKGRRYQYVMSYEQMWQTGAANFAAHARFEGATT